MQSIIWDVLCGVDQIYKMNVIHLDFKPTNMLLNNKGRVLIADFGMSHQLINSSHRLKICAGTPGVSKNNNNSITSYEHRI